MFQFNGTPNVQGNDSGGIFLLNCCILSHVQDVQRDSLCCYKNYTILMTENIITKHLVTCPLLCKSKCDILCKITVIIMSSPVSSYLNNNPSLLLAPGSFQGLNNLIHL